MINKLNLEKAYSRLEGKVRKTPFYKSKYLSDRWEGEVWLKCEHLQEIGAFKIRGAYNMAMQLDEERITQGLVTHSSGNHAQAVAYVAKKMGVKARVVMPENSNRKKIANAKKWGAEVIFCEKGIAAREKKAREVMDIWGGALIPPFDHELIIEGQATCAMEMLSEEEGIDYMFAPLGGGGLLAGTAISSMLFGKNIKAMGCEPENAKDGFEGWKEGERKKEVKGDTIADGLRTTVGETPFEYIKEYVADIILAREKDIMKWMKLVWEEEKMLIEPSSAVPFAAIERQKENFKGKKLAIIITGGNVDLEGISL